jgi:DNA anti-recombination protein RmuC
MYRMGWTDERMDEFARHNDQRFDAVDSRLDRLEDRFAALQLTLLVFSGTIIAALITTQL